MSNNKIFVPVGIGVIIARDDGLILIGKRCGSHAKKYSIPGGGLEPGETFEEAAIREIKEETNLDIENPRVINVTNNLETYKEEGIHHVSVILFTNKFSGDLKNTEPHKCEEWLWCDPLDLPKPHFDASFRAIDMYLSKEFYKKYE